MWVIKRVLNFKFPVFFSYHQISTSTLSPGLNTTTSTSEYSVTAVDCSSNWFPISPYKTEWMFSCKPGITISLLGRAINSAALFKNPAYTAPYRRFAMAFICVIHFVDVMTKRFNPASFLTASHCTRLKSGLCNSSQTPKNSKEIHFQNPVYKFRYLFL